MAYTPLPCVPPLDRDLCELPETTTGADREGSSLKDTPRLTREAVSDLAGVPRESWSAWPENDLGRPAAGEAAVQRLVSRARDGEQSAFEALVKHYHGRIYNHVLRMVQDPVEAEDLAQETFLRAYQALPQFRGESSFQTWLYRIASNLAIDASRRRRRRDWHTVSLDQPAEEESPLPRELADTGARNPEESAETSALRELVWSTIGELSPKLRPVVVLYDLQGRSYEEIARILGCPLGTVKSRLFNARCQLRDKLSRKLSAEVLAALGATLGPLPLPAAAS